MTIAEILESVRYVVDSQGKQTAVQFDIAAWEELRKYLEDKEDIAEMQQAREEEDSIFEWEQVVAEHQAKYDVKPDGQD